MNNPYFSVGLHKSKQAIANLIVVLLDKGILTNEEGFRILNSDLVRREL